MNYNPLHPKKIVWGNSHDIPVFGVNIPIIARYMHHKSQGITLDSHCISVYHHISLDSP